MSLEIINYIIELCPIQKQKSRMTNLLQGNKEIESHRTNCTFVFLPTRRQNLKKQKRNFLPTLAQNYKLIKG